MKNRQIMEFRTTDSIKFLHNIFAFGFLQYKCHFRFTSDFSTFLFYFSSKRDFQRNHVQTKIFHLQVNFPHFEKMIGKKLDFQKNHTQNDKGTVFLGEIRMN